MRPTRLIQVVLLTLLSLFLLSACGALEGGQGPQGEPGETPTESDLKNLVNQAITDRLAEVQGPAGPTGATGPAGTTGLRGITGATGSQGLEGAQGPIGLTGRTGDQGEFGLQGIQGVPGLTGAQGMPGLPGTIADLDSPLTLFGYDYDLSVSQGGWVGIISKPITITKPSKVLVVASATASMSCAINAKCDYQFWLTVATNPVDTGDASEVQVTRMERQMTLPVAINRVISLEPGQYTLQLMGLNETAIGPLIRNVMLTTMVIED